MGAVPDSCAPMSGALPIVEIGNDDSGVDAGLWRDKEKMPLFPRSSPTSDEYGRAANAVFFLIFRCRKLGAEKIAIIIAGRIIPAAPQRRHKAVSPTG